MRYVLVLRSKRAFDQTARFYEIRGKELLDLDKTLNKIEVKTSVGTKRTLWVLFMRRPDAIVEAQGNRLLLPMAWQRACICIYSMPDLEYGLGLIKSNRASLDELDVTSGELERVLSTSMGKFKLYTGRLGMRAFDALGSDMGKVKALVADLADRLKIKVDHRFSEMPDSDMDQVVAAISSSMELTLPPQVQETLYFAFAEDCPTLGEVARWLHQQAPLLRLMQNKCSDLVEVFANEVYTKYGHSVPSQLKSKGIEAGLLLGNGKLKCNKVVEFVETLELQGVHFNRPQVDHYTKPGMSLQRWFASLLDSAHFSKEAWMLAPVELEHAQIFLHQDTYYLVKGTKIEFFPVRNATLDKDKLGKAPETMFVEGNCTYQQCANKQEAELELARHYAKQLENVV